MSQRRQDLEGLEQNNVKRVPGKMRRAYDFSMLFLTFFLVCFGLIMIYSTSSYNAVDFTE